MRQPNVRTKKTGRTHERKLHSIGRAIVPDRTKSANCILLLVVVLTRWARDRIYSPQGTIVTFGTNMFYAEHTEAAPRARAFATRTF